MIQYAVLILLSLSANAASAIPEKFRLHVLLPNVSARDIEITHDTKKNTYQISYLKKPAGERIHKKFSPSVIQDLFAGLWKDAPNYSGWPSDIDCIRRETWNVDVDGVKKRVCYSPKLGDALSKLEKTVALLLR